MAPDREAGSPSEWLDTGSRRRRPRDRRVGAAVIAVVVVIVAVVGVVQLRSSSSTSAPPPPAATTSVARTDPSLDSPSSSATTTLAATPTTAAPVVTRVGHPLFATTGDWELVGYGSESVVRIQPTLGRVTRTRAVAVAGPATVAVGVDFVVVRPWEDGPGRLVRDDRPAQPLTGLLATAQTVGTSLDPTYVWAGTGPQTNSSGEQVRIRLVDPAGRFGGRELAVPPETAGFWGVSDGRGGLVVAGRGGTYLASLDGLRRITSGDLLAIGPTGFLSSECTSRQVCRTVMTDRSAGRRHSLGQAGDQEPVAVGTISPDGHRAVVLLRGSDGSVAVLVDLTTGDRQVLDLPRTTYGAQTQVWSPDSGSLLVTDQHTLFVVDAATARVRALSEVAVPLSVLVVRRT